MLRFYSIPPRFASSWKIKIPPTQDNAWIGGIYTVIQFSGLARGRQPLHDGRIGRRQTRLRFAQDGRDDCLGDVLLLGQASAFFFSSAALIPISSLIWMA